jgi:hypothetical protein
MIYKFLKCYRLHETVLRESSCGFGLRENGSDDDIGEE